MDKAVAAAVFYDRQRHVCIQVARASNRVQYIPLNISKGLRVTTAPIVDFEKLYTLVPDYPVDKACQLFLSYSQNIGATKEALNFLSQIIEVPDYMAAVASAKVVDEVAKPVAKPAAKPVAKPAAKPVAKPAAKPVAKQGRKPSASQMFQDLIMAGKLTDDQIFREVQKTFGLDNSKQGYVKWYRNHLMKQGKNPPAAKN